MEYFISKSLISGIVRDFSINKLDQLVKSNINLQKLNLILYLLAVLLKMVTNWGA